MPLKLAHALAEAGIPILGMLTADLAVQEADRLGIPVYDHVPTLRTAAEKMAEQLVASMPTQS